MDVQCGYECVCVHSRGRRFEYGCMCTCKEETREKGREKDEGGYEKERKRELKRTNGLNISVGKQTRVETNSGFSRSIGQGSALNLASTPNSNRVKYTASETPPPDGKRRRRSCSLLRCRASTLLSVERAKYLVFPP